jgi:hypothetical protein
MVQNVIFLFGRKRLLTTIDRVTSIVSIFGNIVSTAVITSGLIIVVVIISILWEGIIGKKVLLY